MHDPRLLAIAEAERQLFEADYDDYNGTNNSGTAFCRSAALIVSLTASKIVLFHCEMYGMLRRRKQLKNDSICWYPLPGISEPSKEILLPLKGYMHLTVPMLHAVAPTTFRLISLA